MEKKERGERGGQRKRGQREVRAASRTICPGWPRREAGRGRGGRGREKFERGSVGAKRETRKRNRGKRNPG